ncbi:MAG: hypothetical protein GYB64_19100 [Chloroflexi bacterium]|nr:hypothetical protein [Chloroflexota bacterium]
MTVSRFSVRAVASGAIAVAMMLGAAVFAAQAQTPDCAGSRAALCGTAPHDVPAPTGDEVHATFAVNSFLDSVDASPGDGVCADASGDCTLRAAVIEANALPGADTITLPNGTYTLTLAGADEDTAATGDLDVTDTLTITGASRTGTVINANGLDRHFDGLGGSLTLEDMTLSGGDTSLAGDTDGGSIAFGGVDLVLNRVEVSNNVSGFSAGGVAVLFASGTVTITDSIIVSNEAAAWGGGALIEQNATISGTTISLNSAAFDGGGITNNNVASTIDISRSTITANEAGGTGGGIDAYFGATYNLDSVTLAANTALGGAESGFSFTSGGILNAQNTLVAGNTPTTAQCGDADGTYTSNGHNLIQSGSGCASVATDVVSSQLITAILNTTLADNGGPTPTHALVGGSDAIDQGSCAVPGDVDQRGEPRVDLPGVPNGSGNGCDIGAYELTSINLLVNGGFEDPLGAEWNIFASAGGDGRICVPQAFAGSCLFLLKSPAGSIEGARQSDSAFGFIGDTVQVDYQLGYQNTPAGTFAGVRIETFDGGLLLDSTQCPVGAVGTANWQPQSCSLVATLSFDEIHVTFGWTGPTSGRLGFDDISLTINP